MSLISTIFVIWFMYMSQTSIQTVRKVWFVILRQQQGHHKKIFTGYKIFTIKSNLFKVQT